jgi:hypothetical protein
MPDEGPAGRSRKPGSTGGYRLGAGWLMGLRRVVGVGHDEVASPVNRDTFCGIAAISSRLSAA